LPNLELADLKVLRQLPIDLKQERLIFGARLTAVRRDPMRRWTVSFQPDSGILITDPDVAGACCPPVDLEMREVLERQARWVAEIAWDREADLAQ
jgi:hypothetical protein